MATVRFAAVAVMRLAPSSSHYWRFALAVGCVTVVALYCMNVSLSTPGLTDTDVSTWTCGTTAALALAYLKQSKQ